MFKNSIYTVTASSLSIHLFVLHMFAIKILTNPRRFTRAIKFRLRKIPVERVIFGRRPFFRR